MKLAIIGTGMIVGCALECLEQIPSIERKAIYARPHSKDKAQDLAQKYAIQEVYTDYDQLLVFNVTIPNIHLAIMLIKKRRLCQP